MGKCNDSQLYEQSSLKRYLAEVDPMQNMSRTINDVNVPILILGDSAFRLTPNLMKPYPFSVNQEEKEKKIQLRFIQMQESGGECIWPLKSSLPAHWKRHRQQHQKCKHSNQNLLCAA